MLSLISAGVWGVLATAIALLPQRTHRPGAVLLIVTGVPLLGLLTYENGALIGIVGLAAGASVLRWPLFRLGKWLRERLMR